MLKTCIFEFIIEKLIHLNKKNRFIKIIFLSKIICDIVITIL
jgi:hypothetical protein